MKSYIPGSLIAIFFVITVVLVAPQAVSARSLEVEGVISAAYLEEFTENHDHAHHQHAHAPRSEYLVTLTTDTGERYVIDSATADVTSLATGMRVRMKGNLVGDRLEITSLSRRSMRVLSFPKTDASSMLRSSGPTTKRVAVISFNFANDTTTPFTSADIQSGVFTDFDSSRDYIETTTQGGITLAGNTNPDGDYYGWYTLSQTSTVCDYWNWTPEAMALAALDGFIESDYEIVLFVFPETSSCWWDGLAEVGYAGTTETYSAYLNGIGSDVSQVAAHEIYHTFGAKHSNLLYCYMGDGSYASVSEGGTCIEMEYGDVHDVMGTASLYREISGYFRERLGLLGGASAQSITSSGTYTVAPLTGNTGSTVLMIDLPSSSPDATTPKRYYLEYRTPSGIYDDYAPTDDAVNGVLVRRSKENPWYIPAEYPASINIIDTNPATYGSLDAALNVGEVFSDDEEGITIETLSVGPTGAQVRITFTSDLPVASPKGLQAETAFEGAGILGGIPSGRMTPITGLIPG